MRLSTLFNRLFGIVWVLVSLWTLGISQEVPVGDSAMLRMSPSEGISFAIERALPAVVTVESTVAPNRALRFSGFIIDPAGWVVSAAEGVQNARSVRVYLSDGRMFSARVQGVDNITGLALLQIEAPANLPSLRWGNSEAVPVGATVILIGNRGGLEGSVTVGTLGGKDRIGVRPQTQRAVPLLQFNGIVASGEPGAPLLNSQGEVIGVIIGSLRTTDTTEAFARMRVLSPPSAAPTGFAVPSMFAKRSIDELRQRGAVEYAYLGIDYQNAPAGVQVVRVAPNSPAEQVGLQPGDLITGFNGQPVRTSADLTRFLYLARPNQTVELVLLRQGDAVRLRVTLGKQAM